MTVLAQRIEAWGHRAGLDPLDLWFLGLRAAAFGAGIAWSVLAPEHSAAPGVPILAAFLTFSIVLYAVNAWWPGHLATLYRIALVFDLVCVFVMIRTTGGYGSDLYLGFILLVALHAYYFGMETGLAVAVAAGLLYAVAGDWPPPMPRFGLRVGFLGLVGLCMGALAEQARWRLGALERQQEQLLHSDRLATVGELAAGLAHELRNPLAGISGALHVLGSELDADDPRHMLLRDVQGEIGRMNRTLTDLLQHARPARRERIGAEINRLLEQSLTFLPRADIQVVRRLDPALPVVEADQGLLHQAFLNILINARQAMPHGGCLTLETRPAPSGRHVEVRIADTGPGIAPDQLGRIFQPFFTTKPQGTGLGLAIAARVVEQHGGRIVVESSVGRGTTFTIALPVAPPANGARSEPHAAPDPGR